MYILVGLVIFICIISLIITLYIANLENMNYSSDRSIKNQLWLYLILIPVLTLVIVLVMIFI